MEVIVTTFLNPHKFWVFEVNNLNQRNRLERRLAHGDFPRISAPSLGQLALVYKETKWHRALVLSETAPFSCWLVDYGVDHTADSVYEILPEFACTPPLTKKASLNDVVGLHRDCTPTGVQNVGEITFSPGSKKRTNDYLGTAEKVLFTCVKEIGNTHVGEITIITSKISLELSEILIKEQVLIRDPIMFSKAFKMNGDAKEFALLKTSPCNPKMSHDHFDNEPFLGVGRGCSRTSQHTLSPNRSVLSSSEIDDNVKDSPYSDSDLISSSSQLSNNTHLSDNNPKRLTIKKKLEEFLANKSAEVETNSLGNGEVSGLNNELEETTSSQENHESRELMRKHLLNNCSCEQCLGWSEGNFYYNARKKINEVKMKNHRPVKPELLLKTEETSGVPVKIKSSYSSHCGKIERSVKPTVLVHSTTVLTPATSITAAPFHKDIHKALRSYEHVYSIQGYVWPAVMRHLNICIIGKRNSGKTLAYLPGICSFELERQERYSDLPKRTVSPISLLLCPGIEVAEKVYHLVLKLLKDASQKSYVALAVPPVDKYSLNQFEKRVDILVATPVTLLSLLSSRIITLKRLCHLVIEKANVVLERFKKETEEVLNVVQSMLSHRNCNYTVQMILTSEKWTYSIENLSKSLHITPIVCISSYLEAAMYGRVDINVQFLEGKAKIGALIKILKGKSDICRSIVICNTDDEIKEVKQYLLIAGINCLYITEDMEMVEINNIESAWQKNNWGKTFGSFLYGKCVQL
uniref:RNA helicase n=1 Tax=Photinus pyralis TaxID=7054 RepID=A0A1Y1LIJ2_PHOPY